MKWQASAPSNIALIKYMGKTDASRNRPTNASLSYSLDNLRTFVELELSPSGHDQWQPLAGANFAPLDLSASSQARFLKHLELIKRELNFTGHFLVRSANNFPSDCGLASSASSFAALTMAAVQAIREIKGGDLPQMAEQQMSYLSQRGSGSSCRSFFSPWALWREEGAEPCEIPQKNLLHVAVVASSDKKAVSSSEAHKRVTSSLLFTGRVERAESRLQDLLQALRSNKWPEAAQICWAEFWDMHALFETSRPAFGYMNAEAILALQKIRQLWQEHSDGPLTTMDAGPNIHLLFRPDQQELAKTFARVLAPMRIISAGLEQ